jgi:hypothetical protein
LTDEHQSAALTEGETAEVDLLCNLIGKTFDREKADPRLAVIAVEMWAVGLLDLIECPGCRQAAYKRLTTQLPELLAVTMAKHGGSTKHLH